MITYLCIGILLMMVIEIGSPYTWTNEERIGIVLVWPIAALIILRALWQRFNDE